jgi:IS5 family transposase
VELHSRSGPRLGALFLDEGFRPTSPRPTPRRAVKWRTGSEGRISTLKRGYGWDRTRLDGTDGARTWAGYGILAHNLVKISALAS